MVWLPVANDWLLNLDSIREEPGPPNSADFMFPSVSHRGRPRAAKDNQGQKKPGK